MPGHSVENVVRKFPAESPDRFQRTFLDNTQLFQNDQGTAVRESGRGGTAFGNGIFPLAFAPWRVFEPTSCSRVKETAGNGFMKTGDAGGNKHVTAELCKAVSAPFGEVAAVCRSAEDNGALAASAHGGTDCVSGPQKICAMVVVRPFRRRIDRCRFRRLEETEFAPPVCAAGEGEEGI